MGALGPGALLGAVLGEAGTATSAAVGAEITVSERLNIQYFC